jgi:signal transduction histidine kinase
MTTESFSPLFLISNGFTLAFALSFILIILWYNFRNPIYQFFTIFLIMVVIWNFGFLLNQSLVFIEDETSLQVLASTIANIGFAGASASLYNLCALLVGIRIRHFRVLALLGLGVVVGFNLITTLSINILDPLTNSQSSNFSGIFYAIFNTITLYLLWQYRRRIQNDSLIVGVVIFVLGQGFGFLNTDLGIMPISVLLSSIGALIACFAFVRQELIVPLINRNQQLETMHEVSLAITSGITTNKLLTEIAERATRWLNADASGIYLGNEQTLGLLSLFQLPDSLRGTLIADSNSFIAQIAASKKSKLIENYNQLENPEPSFISIFDAFGSVIGTPLIYDEKIIGVLLVIASTRNRIFTQEDVHLLELLASQAAVAISYDQLFNHRVTLANQLEVTNDQLQTVLASTESPVLALNRQFNVIFANRAAEKVLYQFITSTLDPIIDSLPKSLLPKSYLKASRDMRKTGVHIYEININAKTYQCHIAKWGENVAEGWVIVLHDVSELKELDRIKSEMVRMTSHDLKNPLQAALANLDLLKDDLEELAPNNDEVNLSVHNVEKQLSKMQHIISGILDLERVRLGVHLTEICYPEDILVSIRDEMSDFAKDRGIRLNAVSNVSNLTFLGDRNQFVRALVNLVDNAIKFTQIDGDVEVTVNQKDSDIVFSVKDNGVGIPSELHEKIFERFYRGQQKGIEHISGTGLGLSLVKAVVESHHGRIWVESKLGEGAIFYVSIPSIKEPSTAI